jgi:hypothetical protein
LWIVSTSHAFVTEIIPFDLLSHFHGCSQVALCFVTLLWLCETTKMVNYSYFSCAEDGMEAPNNEAPENNPQYTTVYVGNLSPEARNFSSYLHVLAICTLFGHASPFVFLFQSALCCIYYV